ncbi:MAG: hypothetical protein U0941_29845 [Planctomycetaceae bacterium]
MISTNTLIFGEAPERPATGNASSDNSNAGANPMGLDISDPIQQEITVVDGIATASSSERPVAVGWPAAVAK